MSDLADRRIPLDGLVFGFGPMLPFAAAAIGAWTLPRPWPHVAIELAILLGALLLAFLAGVRRGYGFGAARASTAREIATMLCYFLPAGVALILGVIGREVEALALLTVGFTAVALFDRRAAFAGDAPRYFARLRPPQMAIAVVSLAALLSRVVTS